MEHALVEMGVDASVWCMDACVEVEVDVSSAKFSISVKYQVVEYPVLEQNCESVGSSHGI